MSLLEVLSVLIATAIIIGGVWVLVDGDNIISANAACSADWAPLPTKIHVGRCYVAHKGLYVDSRLIVRK
jgi:hypothetical protein